MRLTLFLRNIGARARALAERLGCAIAASGLLRPGGGDRRLIPVRVEARPERRILPFRRPR
jgi:hypothetical protein